MDLRLPPLPGSAPTPEPVPDVAPAVETPAEPALPWDPLASRQSRRAAAKAATDEAVHRVAGNTDPEWRAQALSVVRMVCVSHATFTSDDVWPHLSGTHNNAALGPVMRQAANNGWCVYLGEQRASLVPARHQQPLRLWTSLLHSGEAAEPREGDTQSLYWNGEAWGRMVLCYECEAPGDACSMCKGTRKLFQPWTPAWS